MNRLTAAPDLTSARLRLRAHRAGDFESLETLWSDPQVVHHISGRPATPGECWARLLRYAGLWQVLGFGYWAVETHSGEFVGDVGLADFKRDITPSLGSDPEAGWVLNSRFHGQGFGSEAMQTVLNWADLTLRARQISCIISPGNSASIALAAKLGFAKSHRAQKMGDPVDVFVRSRTSDQAVPDG